MKSTAVAGLLALLLSFELCAQGDGATNFGPLDETEDFNLGGDIFSDFNEEIESSQVMEDERFYRYGRFYSLNIGAGMTNFTGNRGRAYENDGPSFSLSVHYFSDFQSSFGMGVGYSKHNFDVPFNVKAWNYIKGERETGPGLIEVNMVRMFFSYRYYIDTSNLGTAITWSNPYLTGRFEYWYQTMKYREQDNIDNESHGAVGGALGAGLEFPIKIRESYVGLELLYHQVSFFDKNTSDYRPTGRPEDQGFGYEDLSGAVWTATLSYVISW